MAYETGTATDVSDLATKLQAFLVAEGWTSDRFDTQGTGKRLQVHKGSVFFSMRWLQNENGPTDPGPGGSNVYGVILVPATGYSAGSDWDAQAGIPLASDATTKLGVGFPLLTGAISAYHFFSDAGGDNIWVVVQRTGTAWNYLGFGTAMRKYGTWTGGAWCSGTRAASALTVTGGSTWGNAGITLPPYPPGFGNNSLGTAPATLVRVDVDAVTNTWLGVSQASGANRTTRRMDSSLQGGGFNTVTGNSWCAGALQARGRSALNNSVVLVEAELSVERTSGLYSPIGVLPDVWAINITDGGFVPGSDVTISSDTYVVFPTFAILKAA